MTGSSFDLRPARRSDLPEILALLENASLPLDGVEEAREGFVVARSRGQIVGSAGLEVHGEHGLLRSVVVDPRMRGRGLGQRLSERILRSARSLGLVRVYLLTTTAEAYFQSRGFRPVERSAAPPAIRRSVEFQKACPDSAVAMVRDMEPTSEAG